MGSLFGSKNKTTTSTTVVDLPSWIESPIKSLTSRTRELSERAYDPYTGERLASFTPDEQQAFDLARGLIGQTDLGPSQGILSDIATRGLEGYTQAQLQPFMNPYIENVLDINRRRQFENFDRARNQLQSRAAQTAAFGGSRYGLAEAELSRGFQQDMAEYAQRGLYDAYNEGLNRALQGSQLAGGAATDLARTQQAQQQASLQDITTLQGIGAQQRALEQAGLDIGYQDYLTEQAFPYEQIQFANSIYQPTGALVRGETNTSVQKGQKGGFLQNALGIASLVAAPFTGGTSLMGGFGSALGGLGSALGTTSALGAGVNTFMNSVGRAPNAYGPFENANFFGRYNDGGVIERENTPTDFENFFPTGTTELGDDIIMYLPEGKDTYTQQDINAALRSVVGDGPVPERLITYNGDYGSDTTENKRDYFDVLAEIESSGNPKAVNKATGAAGLYQFIPSTAKAYGLKDPHDPEESLKAVKKFDKDNTKILAKKLGRKPTEGERYLAHQQGPSTAAKLILNADEPAIDVLTKIYKDRKKAKRALELNAGSTDMTAGDFANKWIRKFEDKLYGEQKLADGGTVASFSPDYQDPSLTPFQNLLNKLGNKRQGALESLLGAQMGIVGGLESASKYFTTPVGQQNIQTPIEAQVEDANLALALNRLQRGQLPHNLRKMMNEIGDYADKDMTNVYLGGDEGNTLVPRKQTPSTDPQQIQEIVKQLSKPVEQNITTTEKPKQKETSYEEPTRKKEEKKDINLPLLAFGASLFVPDSPMGRASRAFVSTKIQEKAAEQEAMREEARMELARRKAANNEALARAQQQKMDNPITKELQRLKLAQAMKDYTEKDINRLTETIFKGIIENNVGVDPAEAMKEARRIAMTTSVLNNVQASQPQGNAITLEEYLR